MVLRMLLVLYVMIGLLPSVNAAEPLSRQETAATCAPPDAIFDFIEKVEKLSCDTGPAREDHLRCQTCPDLAELQRYTKRQRNDDVCRENLRWEFACQRSPWKNFTIQERYREILRLMDSVSTPLPKELFACISAKESLWMDPVSITCTDLSGKTTQTGLGHVLRATFADIFGYDKNIVARTREPERTALLRSIRENILKADWLRPYNCKSFPGIATEDLPNHIFADAYQRDPLIQLAAMAKVLHMKSGLKRNSDPKNFIARLPETVKNYNGSSSKAEYSETVMKCLKCLTVDKKAPLGCLQTVSKQNYGNGNICTR